MKPTTLTLGFSPCPNDCFIFDAIVNRRIDTRGWKFDVRLEDVETLNRLSAKGALDITKLSFAAFANFSREYILLRAGSALGFGCGPLLVARRQLSAAEIRSVAIPGKLTTANFLFSLAFPQVTDKREHVFSDIEDAVLRGEVDAGLIIHENRFTYRQKGLVKLMDLGEFWEKRLDAPIPLGGIAGKRALGDDVLQEVSGLIRTSVQHAFDHPQDPMPYVREHAQAMSDEVMKQHIALYVNEFSEELGAGGESALEILFDTAAHQGAGISVQRPFVIPARD